MEKLFTKHHEYTHKDLVHAFGVLQALWNIMMYSVHTHSIETMGHISKACIIMHNMIVDNKRILM